MAYSLLPKVAQDRLNKSPSYAYKRARLIAVGGREWAKGTTHRVYLSQRVALLAMGAHITFQGGRIVSAYLDGDPIPASQANALIKAADSGLYFDLGKDMWGSKDLSAFDLMRYTPRLNEFFEL